MKIIIAGAGSVGSYLTERLVGERHQIVVIDREEEILEQISSQFDVQTLVADANSVRNLKLAGVETADLFIAATDSDETNLISCLLVHHISDSIRKIARIRKLALEEFPEQISDIFDRAINPDREAVNALVKLFEVPGACEVLDFADDLVRVVGVTLPAESPVVDTCLKDLPRVEGSSRMLVAAIDRDGELIIPRGDDVLLTGDTVYVVTEPAFTEQVFSTVGLAPRPIRKVMIWGGNVVGIELAKRLAENEVRVKLLESNPKRSEETAEQLEDVVVLQGSGTDQELLLDEGVADFDVFVSVTDDEENNILSALLAKRLGVKTTAVLVNKMSYLNLVTAVGVDITVNPRVAAASSMLHFVRSGGVSSVVPIRDDTAEVLEIRVKAQSKLVGRPLRELKTPKGVLVAGIVGDGKVTIPRGDTIVAPGDKVVIFAKRDILPRLEKFLDTRLSWF